MLLGKTTQTKGDIVVGGPVLMETGGIPAERTAVPVTMPPSLTMIDDQNDQTMIIHPEVGDPQQVAVLIDLSTETGTTFMMIEVTEMGTAASTTTGVAVVHVNTLAVVEMATWRVGWHSWNPD